jgi:hypothetical protein
MEILDIKTNSGLSNKSDYAAWVLFRDESIDVGLRVAIAVQALKINITQIVMNQNFRPNQIEIDPYDEKFFCGEKAFLKLKGL